MSRELPKTISHVEAGMREGLHVGFQLYASLQGEVVADLAMGISREDVPLRPDMPTLWLSATKPVAAVAIGQLLERGLLDIQDRVGRFVPEFANRGKEAVTIEHLLTHTGGFRTADKCDSGAGWDEIIACICAAPLEPGWVPGEKAGYHISSSWYLLGELVRRLDGRPFEQYVRDEIFEPLGMRDSWIGMSEEQLRDYGDRITTVHVTEKVPPAPHPTLNEPAAVCACRPGSNGRGPIRELGLFYEMLLNEGRARDGATILKPETVKLLTARRRVGKYDQTFMHVIDTGLGFILNSNRYGMETVPYGYGRHASEETFGHSGAQSSSAFADPRRGLVVAWVFNGMVGERRHQKRAREINTVIYEDLNLA